MIVLSHCGGVTVSSTPTSSPTQPVSAGAMLITYHNDLMRTGLNASETILTPSNAVGRKGFDFAAALRI